MTLVKTVKISDYWSHIKILYIYIYIALLYFKVSVLCKIMVLVCRFYAGVGMYSILKYIIFLVSSSSVKRKNVDGLLEPNRAQNIGTVCTFSCTVVVVKITVCVNISLH